MNKKRLALIAIVAVLIIVVITVAFAQLLTQNNKASNTSPSFPSSSTSQSLTPDEIATLKADSFELEIKDMIEYPSESPGVSFIRVFNETKLDPSTISALNNATNVSETVFLGDINSILSEPYNQQLLGIAPVMRVGNTFYFGNCVSYTP